MRKYQSRILIVVIVIVMLLGGGYMYLRSVLNGFHEKDVKIADIGGDSNNKEEQGNKNENEEKNPNVTVSEDGENEGSEEITDAYLQMIRSSNRVNVLCIGLADNNLADTMIVASFDPSKKQVDLISVPRDTYYHRKGYEDPGQKKINASYVGKTSAAKAQSAMNAVRDVLNIPIHHFVKVEYEGVERIVDSIGGVEIDIPFKMDYDDPDGNLHIHFEEGTRVLNGSESVEFLRFRKNNDNSHSDGDLGRISRQQQFISKAMKKSLSFEIFGLVNTAQKHIKTSMSADELIYFAQKLMKVKEDNISSHLLLGEPKTINKTNYYIHDKDETRKLIIEIYEK